MQLIQQADKIVIHVVSLDSGYAQGKQAGTVLTEHKRDGQPLEYLSVGELKELLCNATTYTKSVAGLID